MQQSDSETCVYACLCVTLLIRQYVFTINIYFLFKIMNFTFAAKNFFKKNENYVRPEIQKI